MMYRTYVHEVSMYLVLRTSEYGVVPTREYVEVPYYLHTPTSYPYIRALTTVRTYLLTTRTVPTYCT